MKRLITLLTVAALSGLTLSAFAEANRELSSAVPGDVVNAPATSSPQTFEFLADGELSFGEHPVIATLELENRSVLRFVQLAEKQIAVLEDAPQGAKSIGSVGIPADTAISEVFYAFSAPGTAIPKALGTSPISEKKPQGWARPMVNAPLQIAQSITSNCTNSNFRNWFNSFPYNDRGTPDFRLDQVPRTSSFFERYTETPGNGEAYRFYRYIVGGTEGSQWYNIDRYVSRVSVCAIDATESYNPGGRAHPSISYQGYSNDHMGPIVSMMYRRPNEAGWHVATRKDFAASEVGKTLSWHFYTDENWDWQTRILWAGGDDSFDIGHALEDL